MPVQARVDATAAVQHMIVVAFIQSAIFRDNVDRDRSIGHLGWCSAVQEQVVTPSRSL